MCPIALQLGGFTIYWYGVCAALGFLAAGLLIGLNRKYAGMSSDQASGTLLVAMVAGIAGARIFYVVQFFDHYRDNLWGIFRIDQGGLVFYGGFILAMAALWIYCRRQKLDVIRVFDVFGPALALAHAFGRIGCFTKGCCFGHPVQLVPGVVFPAGSAPAAYYGTVPLHAVQLYEAAENLLVCILLFWLLRKCRRGVTMAVYMIIYGAMRFVNEFFRGDNPRPGGLTPAQWIGLVLIPAGVGLLIWFRRHEREKA